MIAAILWKEYRDHRVTWVMLALAGAATVFGLPMLLGPESLQAVPGHNQVVFAVILVAWAYGLICGAMLLAGEREMGTLAFLDALPGLRGQLWRSKCLAGVLFVTAQIVVLMGLCAVGRLFETWLAAAVTLLLMSGAALFGLAWGMLFSAFGRNVLNMILGAMMGQLGALAAFFVLAGFIAAVLAAIMSASDPPGIVWSLSWAAVAAASIPGALGASALVFSRPDRGRKASPRPPARVQQSRSWGAWRQLVWMTARQSRFFAASLSLFSLLLGFFALADGVIVWPVASLLIGVLCGVTAFADEQQGPYRFLGDQRFPLIGFWIVKVSVRFLIAVAAAFLALQPCFFRLMSGPPGRVSLRSEHLFDGAFWALTFHSPLLLRFGPPWVFLTLWLVCGFCAGCLFGLLLRNGLASGVFALGTAFLLAGVWGPSMLGGGLSFWQTFGPPLLLLAATPLLLRPWAAGRLASWSTFRRLAPFILLAAAWIAFGLWYRVIEIPDVAPKYDLTAFEARLPKEDENAAGELVRSACARFAALTDRFGLQGMPNMAAPANPQAPPSRSEQLTAVLSNGWPAADAELDRWLNQLCKNDRPLPELAANSFALLAAPRGQGPLLAASALTPPIDEWRLKLAEAADLPAGMVADPRHLTVDDVQKSSPVESAASIAVVLAAHGLQQQAHGDDAAFVDDLRAGLALSRNLRHFGTRQNMALGKSVESTLLVGLERWLEKWNGRADVLKPALAILSKHRKETETEDDDRAPVDYLIARNTLEYPVGWLAGDLAANAAGAWSAGPLEQDEALLIVQARLTPWEHAREARMLRVLFAVGRGRWQSSWDGEAMLGSIRYLQPSTVFPDISGFRVCRPAALQLRMALMLFQLDRGRPAANLDELVPQYLPKLPDDPYRKGYPFGYRVSKGERIAIPSNDLGGQPRKVFVAPGVGVLWSIGQDGKDDGGVEQAQSNGVCSYGEDVIFLVPVLANGR
ncbi:MAG TPA: hypothetical protein VMS17_01095 [Gemmataceae bacterium]|nr:hypothetical protein [Gemmataceae bacterium]